MPGRDGPNSLGEVGHRAGPERFAGLGRPPIGRSVGVPSVHQPTARFPDRDHVLVATRPARSTGKWHTTMYDQTRAQQPASSLPGRADRRTPGREPLLPSSERSKLDLRLQHALNIYADNPTQALEEAEGAFDEAIAQLVNTLTERRVALHAAWQEQEEGRARDPEEDQEQGQEQGQDLEARSTALRLALREYREVTQRLLRI